MSIKTKCKSCGNRVSVDDAFAGSVFRCPYCKTINVPTSARVDEGGARPRPDAPPRPDRPAHGRGPAVTRVAATSAPAHGPVHEASPVRKRGILGLIMIVLLVAMIAGGVAVGIHLTGGEDTPADTIGDGQSGGNGFLDPGPTGDRANPFINRGQGAVVAGDVPLTLPVVYVIDWGTSMRTNAIFDYASQIVLTSLRSLPDQGRYALAMAESDRTRWQGDGLQNWSPERVEPTRDFLVASMPGGDPNLADALTQALQRKPSQVVLLTNRAIETPKGLAEAFGQQGVRLTAVVLSDRQSVQQAYANLVEATGAGQVRVISPDNLPGDFEQAQGQQ